MDQQHHYGWMAVVLIMFGVCTYIFAINRPNADNYGKDSTHNEQHRQDWPLSFHIGEGGCASLSAERKLIKKQETKTPVVNAVK